jgi:hypothetical protein
MVLSVDNSRPIQFGEIHFKEVFMLNEVPLPWSAFTDEASAILAKLLNGLKENRYAATTLRVSSKGRFTGSLTDVIEIVRQQTQNAHKSALSITATPDFSVSDIACYADVESEGYLSATFWIDTDSLTRKMREPIGFCLFAVRLKNDRYKVYYPLDEEWEEWVTEMNADV